MIANERKKPTTDNDQDLHLYNGTMNGPSYFVAGAGAAAADFIKSGIRDQKHHKKRREVIVQSERFVLLH